MKARIPLTMQQKKQVIQYYREIANEEQNDIFMRVGNMWLYALKLAGYKAESAERLKDIVEKTVLPEWGHYCKKVPYNMSERLEQDGAADDHFEILLADWPHYEPESRI